MFGPNRLVMSTIIIKGKKLDFNEIHDHLLNCKKCRKARKDFHDMFEWHKKALDDYAICTKCENPIHLENCVICLKYMEKFRLTLSMCMIEIVLRKL